MKVNNILLDIHLTKEQCHGYTSIWELCSNQHDGKGHQTKDGKFGEKTRQHGK